MYSSILILAALHRQQETHKCWLEKKQNKKNPNLKKLKKNNQKTKHETLNSEERPQKLSDTNTNSTTCIL